MARKRMIDPSFWTDEKLGECTRDERLLFMGLVSNADDEGYGRANPKLLRSSIFPYDDLRTSDLEKWLSHLGGLNLIVLYTVNGQTYYYLPNFTKHQTINKPTKSILPKPSEELPYNYGTDTAGLLPKRKEEKLKEDNILSEGEAPPNCKIVINLTTNDKSEFPVYDNQVEEWKDLYPIVDVIQELKKMKGWLDANPKRRKTKSGMLRFINSWLSKQQDNGHPQQETKVKQLD